MVLVDALPQCIPSALVRAAHPLFCLLLSLCDGCPCFCLCAVEELGVCPVLLLALFRLLLLLKLLELWVCEGDAQCASVGTHRHTAE